MSNADRASDQVKMVRHHYSKFYNMNIDQAYDDVAHPDYSHNGNPPAHDNGEYLKNWAREMHETRWPNVNIVLEIEEKNFVAIYWVSNPVDKKTGERLETNHGINVFRFKDGKIFENYHAASPLYPE